MIRFCFTRLRCTPSVEPQSAKFSAHSYANDFANPANPVLTPWFIFYCSNDGARGAGGGVGGGVVEDLSLTMYFFTAGPTQIYTSQPFSLHCNKSSFTSLDITMGQDKIYGWSAQLHSIVYSHWFSADPDPVF